MVTENVNVGVGTTLPQSKLDVNGAVIFGSGIGKTTFNVVCYFCNAEYNTTYVHLKLPFKIESQNNKMFHIKVRGYAYEISKIIDLTFAGFAWGNGGSIIRTSVYDPLNFFEPSIYQGSDDYAYLRFKVTKTYCLSFTVDSLAVGGSNFEKILKLWDITVTLSPNQKL